MKKYKLEACLRGFQQSKTHLQNSLPARILKLWLKQVLYWTFQQLNNKGANQTVRILRLLYVFVFRVQQSQVSSNEAHIMYNAFRSGPSLQSCKSKPRFRGWDVGGRVVRCLLQRCSCHY